MALEGMVGTCHANSCVTRDMTCDLPSDECSPFLSLDVFDIPPTKKFHLQFSGSDPQGPTRFSRGAEGWQGRGSMIPRLPSAPDTESGRTAFSCSWACSSRFRRWVKNVLLLVPGDRFLGHDTGKEIRYGTKKRIHKLFFPTMSSKG